MEAAWKLTWDYLGHNSNLIFDQQKDWNQTLITRFNEISAQIFKASMCGGANCISIHPDLLELVKTLAYYRGDSVGKYKINLDVTLPKDIIYPYHSGITMEPITFVGDDGSDGDIDVWLHSESPKLEEYKTKTGISLHIITPDRLVGEVKIINYNIEN